MEEEIKKFKEEYARLDKAEKFSKKILKDFKEIENNPEVFRLGYPHGLKTSYAITQQLIKLEENKSIFQVDVKMSKEETT